MLITQIYLETTFYLSYGWKIIDFPENLTKKARFHGFLSSFTTLSSMDQHVLNLSPSTKLILKRFSATRSTYKHFGRVSCIPSNFSLKEIFSPRCVSHSHHHHMALVVVFPRIFTSSE